MASVIAFPFAILWMTPAVLWQAYVSAILWGWFVVPFGLPALSVAWAVGLSSLLAVLRPGPYIGGKRSLGESLFVLARPILNPALALLIGWLALHWMPQP